jgi:hypothetical protein
MRMEWIPRSTHTALSTGLTRCSADGSSTTHLPTPQSLPILDPRSLSTPALLQALRMAFLSSFRCSLSHTNIYFRNCIADASLQLCLDAGASITTRSQASAAAAEGCNVPGCTQQDSARPLHHLQPPSPSLRHNRA